MSLDAAFDVSPIYEELASAREEMNTLLLAGKALGNDEIMQQVGNSYRKLRRVVLHSGDTDAAQFRTDFWDVCEIFLAPMFDELRVPHGSLSIEKFAMALARIETIVLELPQAFWISGSNPLGMLSLIDGCCANLVHTWVSQGATCGMSKSKIHGFQVAPYVTLQGR